MNKRKHDKETLSFEQQDILEDLYKQIQFPKPDILSDIATSFGVQTCTLFRWFSMRRRVVTDKSLSDMRWWFADLLDETSAKKIKLDSSQASKPIYKGSTSFENNEPLENDGEGQSSNQTKENSDDKQTLKDYNDANNAMNLKKGIMNKRKRSFVKHDKETLSFEQQDILEDLYKQIQFPKPDILSDIATSFGVQTCTLFRWFSMRRRVVTDKSLSEMRWLFADLIDETSAKKIKFDSSQASKPMYKGSTSFENNEPLENVGEGQSSNQTKENSDDKQMEKDYNNNDDEQMVNDANNNFIVMNLEEDNQEADVDNVIIKESSKYLWCPLM